MVGLRLRALDRKLLRDLWSTRLQAAAIALVIGAGVSVHVTFSGLHESLSETRRAYYERYDFADVTARVVRAPRARLEHIRALPGVLAVEGRVRGSAVLDLPDFSDPITAELLSLPAHREPRVNRLHLVSGRTPDPARPDEVVALDSFAVAHDLAPGATIEAVIHGTRRRLVMVGTALSPEHIYTIAPGQLVPDPARVGVLWLGEEALAAALDMDGAFNEVCLTTSRGAGGPELLSRIDSLLDSFGGIGAGDREQQPSHEFLDNELQQLESMGRLLPPIFLAVAVFLLHVVMGRVVATERERIGLLKAFGYTDGAIARHYTAFVLVIALLGVALGIALGLMLGNMLSLHYKAYFKFPFLIFKVGPRTLLTGTIWTVGAILTGTLWTVRSAARLDPAVAMRPAPPADHSRGIGHLLRTSLLDPPTRMVLRNLAYHPLRSLLTLLGISAAMALLIGTTFFASSVDRLIDVSFNVIQRQDMTITLTEARSRTALLELRRLPGVLEAEPFRTVDARLSHGPRQVRQPIVGLTRGARLSRLVDADLAPVEPPRAGLALSAQLAKKLGVGPGDPVHVQVMSGRRPRLTLPVARVITTFMGSPAHMEIGALNRAMGEGPVVSGMWLRVDTARAPALHRRLKDTPAVAAVSNDAASERLLRHTIDQTLGAAMAIYVLFAGMIAVGVITNSVRIALSERERELASLRVLGFTTREVSAILVGEIAILAALAVPPGQLLGELLAHTVASSAGSDLLRIPVVISPTIRALAVAIVMIVTAISAAFAHRHLARLDLVSCLKMRD